MLTKKDAIKVEINWWKEIWTLTVRLKSHVGSSLETGRSGTHRVICLFVCDLFKPFCPMDLWMCSSYCPPKVLPPHCSRAARMKCQVACDQSGSLVSIHSSWYHNQCSGNNVHVILFSHNTVTMISLENSEGLSKFQSFAFQHRRHDLPSRSTRQAKGRNLPWKCQGLLFTHC